MHTPIRTHMSDTSWTHIHARAHGSVRVEWRVESSRRVEWCTCEKRLFLFCWKSEEKSLPRLSSLSLSLSLTSAHIATARLGENEGNNVNNLFCYINLFHETSDSFSLALKGTSHLSLFFIAFLLRFLTHLCVHCSTDKCDNEHMCDLHVSRHRRLWRWLTCLSFSIFLSHGRTLTDADRQQRECCWSTNCEPHQE